MRRRFFLQRLGLGTTGLVTSSRFLHAIPVTDDRRFTATGIQDLYNAEGHIMIRFNYSSDDLKHQVTHEGRFSVRKGKIVRIRSWFFSPGIDDMDPAIPGMNILSSSTNEDVVVLWIADAKPSTSITFPVAGGKRQATIGEIIEQGDLEYHDGNARVTVSYLMDKEIGMIDPGKSGIRTDGNHFSFTIMADPQGGNPFAHEKVRTRMRIHNAFIDETVNITNQLDPAPAFNIVIGDIVDGQGHHADYNAMNEMLEKVEVPTLYTVGNHETKYRSVFSPGYNMKAFDNFFAAQEAFNGMDKLLYSFNLGQWHFIAWPDPLRKNFWQTHPHYFDWLEQDLEKHRERPTIFFQHIPMHPIGILPLINYAETVDVKRTLLDILAKHGNVKYVFSGHVHIPMKASVKTAVKYRGMTMINLPAAGYRPRAFGEEDFNGGPSQGVAIVHVRGRDAAVQFKSVTGESFTYPTPEPFREKEYPLWLHHKYELAHDPPLLNGDFSEGTDHWHRRYVYTEDVHPSNICEPRSDDQGNPYLYLFNRSRGYSAPGQDRLPQSINRICQVVNQPPGTFPVLTLSCRLDPEYHVPGIKAGMYIWLEGFERGLKRLNVVYSNDYVHWQLGGDQDQLRTTLPVHMEIPAPAGQWHTLTLNPTGDFIRYTEDEKLFLDSIDAFAINFGVWTINEGFKNAVGAGIRDVRLEFAGQVPGESLMNGEALQKKEQKYLWWHGVKHYAGEHKSYLEDLNRYF